jgi:hypothetical protein
LTATKISATSTTTGATYTKITVIFEPTREISGTTAKISTKTKWAGNTGSVRGRRRVMLAVFYFGDSENT